MPKGRFYTKRDLLFMEKNIGVLKVRAMARLLDRSETAVRQALEYYGLSEKVTPRSAWEPSLRHWHKKGLSDKQLAARLGWSRTCVRKRREKLGLLINREPRCKWARQFTNLHQRGYSIGEIAYELGLTIYNAYRIHRRLQLKPNLPSGRPRVPNRLKQVCPVSGGGRGRRY